MGDTERESMLMAMRKKMWFFIAMRYSFHAGNCYSDGWLSSKRMKVEWSPGTRHPSVKSPFWSSSVADQIIEFFSRSRSVLRRHTRCARRALVKCSPTSDNIMLDPQPCWNHYLRNACWCLFHRITRVSLSLDRVSRSFLHSSTSFNSLARYAVPILPSSIIAPPMLCHQSTRQQYMLGRKTSVTPPSLDRDSTDAGS